MNFEQGQQVRVVNNKPLAESGYAPDIKVGDEYPILNIVLDKKGNQHLDIGLKSKLNFITSIETGEELPNGHLVHWCHPSRFELIK